MRLPAPSPPPLRGRDQGWGPEDLSRHFGPFQLQGPRKPKRTAGSAAADVVIWGGGQSWELRTEVYS